MRIPGNSKSTAGRVAWLAAALLAAPALGSGSVCWGEAGGGVGGGRVSRAVDTERVLPPSGWAPVVAREAMLAAALGDRERLE